MNTENCVILSSLNTDAPINLPTGTTQPHAEVDVIATGITSLDHELGGGARAGTLNLICAYTGDGNSSLVIHLAQTAASLGHPVLIYHYGMTREDYLGRLESWESGKAYRDISGVNPKNSPLIKIVSLRSNKHCGVSTITTDIRALKEEHELMPVI